jgi:hypothetical protein
MQKRRMIYVYGETMKKGGVHALMWLAIFVLVVLFVGLAFFVIGLLTHVPGTGMKTMAYSIDFVNEANRPYLVAEILAHYGAGDRQFFEHALQIVVTGSPKNTNSFFIEDLTKNFLDYYDMNYYSISIEDKDERDLLVFSNIDRRCGDAGKGVCVNKFVNVCKKNYSPLLLAFSFSDPPYCRTIAPKYGECGNGRIRIEDKNDDCESYQSCCMEKIDESGHNLDDKGNIIPNCGPQGKKIGVCDDEKVLFITSVWPLTSKYTHVYGCREGRTRIEKEKEECGGEGPEVCCIPKSQASELNLITEARVPILYKNGIIGYMEVMTGV